ncbi:hypothetical protein ACFXCR_00915 [Streptomyces sp. NPDC059431]|uniref:hypothetical protein n=1 Tax=Streptomyces sp. NPDC059431 TaxID=3346828 RepID=UPI0036CD950B
MSPVRATCGFHWSYAPQRWVSRLTAAMAAIHLRLWASGYQDLATLGPRHGLRSRPL